MMKNLLSILALSMVAMLPLQSFAQLPDTLKRGDLIVILTEDSTFYLMQESTIANGAYDLIEVVRDSASLRDRLINNYLNATGEEGKAIDIARRQGKSANQLRWLISQFDANVNVYGMAKDVYSSQLQGTYVLRYDDKRIRMKLNENLAAKIDKVRYSLKVSSITNIQILGVEDKPIKLTTSVVQGLVKTWTGEDSKGNIVTLKKVK
jgi:hypothetical protein